MLLRLVFEGDDVKKLVFLRCVFKEDAVKFGFLTRLEHTVCIRSGRQQLHLQEGAREPTSQRCATNQSASNPWDATAPKMPVELPPPAPPPHYWATL